MCPNAHPCVANMPSATSHDESRATIIRPEAVFRFEDFIQKDLRSGRRALDPDPACAAPLTDSYRKSILSPSQVEELPASGRGRAARGLVSSVCSTRRLGGRPGYRL